MSNNEKFPDADKIKDILDVVTEKVPGLIKELSNLLYSPASSKNFASSAAIFYKELKAAGMNDEQAFELTKQYMSTLSLGSMIKGDGNRNINIHGHH